MVFMVASTNLVFELGIVLWLLIGFQFALAEFVGGTIMIVLLGIMLPRVIPESWVAEARARLNDETMQFGGAHADHGDPTESSLTQEPWRTRLRSMAGWADAASFTVSDLTMLRRELVIGFGVAGFLAAWVPDGFWRALFLTGHGFGSSVENVVLGPFLAIISFVCSIGNVALAAALWQGGISFGGVISFVFADLITLPLLSTYRKYYGTALTLRLLGALWAVMSLSGLATEYLFRAVSLATPARPTIVVRTGFFLNYTSVLDVVALIALACLYWTYRHRGRFDGPGPAAAAPASTPLDHCRHRFNGDS